MAHLLALVLTALAMALVMTPAALHRISEPKSVSERLVWMASKMVLAVFAWLWFLLPRREHSRQGQSRAP